MKKCKYCQSEIDAKAKICPNCKKKQGMSKWLIVLIVIVGIIAIASIAGGDNAKEGDALKESDKNSEKFTYEITKQYKDELGLAYYIEGGVKNNRKTDYSYVQIEFVCYDASGNNLGTAIDNTNNLLANETWKFKAMGMFTDAKNVDHCDYHEITSW